MTGISTTDNESLDFILNWFEIFHIWDFIAADATSGKPNWITIKKYPLSPKTLYERWRNPDELVGVRFKTAKEGKTFYLMIDIDINSSFHPCNNPGVFKDLIQALEEIGLCCHILVRSSKSEGLHIYFPLPEPLSCYGLARAVRRTVEEKGFEVKAGQLEIFPNVKSPKSLYQAHRLPLQADSYVLDANLLPVHNDLKCFIRSWYQVAAQQDVELLKQGIESGKTTFTNSRADVIEWRQRLEENFEKGWTGAGQTDRIIMETHTYAIVFLGLEADELEDWVTKTVVNLPGYQKFCNHKREIRRRVRDWGKTNRKSKRYYPNKNSYRSKASNAPSNEKRKADAEERIKLAISRIEEEFEKLPEGVRKRQNLICKYAHCSATTLRKYSHLWHPNETQENSSNKPKKTQ